MQRLGALSGHLTKLQLQKNLSHSQNLLSNTCSAWSLSSSEFQRFSQVAAVVFFRNGRRSRQCPRVALLLVPSPLFLHRTNAWRLAGVGDEQQKVRRPVTDAGGGFADATGDTAPTTPPSAAQTTGARRVAFHSPERAAALVVNRRARSALSAAVEPVRSPHRGPTPLRQDHLRLAVKRLQ